MSKTAARLALLCALVGLGASVAAAYVHYHCCSTRPTRSFCDVNATVSCTQVYMSRLQHRARHPGRDLRRHLVRGCGAAVGDRPVGAAAPCGRACPGICSPLSTLALAVVLYFGYVSFVVLKAVCVLCLTMRPP